jgi:quercetin dioxygenase-like cupin family protein
MLREGVEFRPLANGERTSLGEFRSSRGSVIPEHCHPHEQTGYLVSGALVFTIAGERFEARPGDAWNIRGGLPHGVDVLDDSVVIEVFSPPREDHLPAACPCRVVP